MIVYANERCKTIFHLKFASSAIKRSKNQRSACIGSPTARGWGQRHVTGKAWQATHTRKPWILVNTICVHLDDMTSHTTPVPYKHNRKALKPNNAIE